MGSHNPGALTTGAINATTAWARTKQHNARPKALQTLTCRVNLHLRHNQRVPIGGHLPPRAKLSDRKDPVLRQAFHRIRDTEPTIRTSVRPLALRVSAWCQGVDLRCRGRGSRHTRHLSPSWQTDPYPNHPGGISMRMEQPTSCPNAGLAAPVPYCCSVARRGRETLPAGCRQSAGLSSSWTWLVLLNVMCLTPTTTETSYGKFRRVCSTVWAFPRRLRRCPGRGAVVRALNRVAGPRTPRRARPQELIKGRVRAAVEGQPDFRIIGRSGEVPTQETQSILVGEFGWQEQSRLLENDVGNFRGETRPRGKSGFRSIHVWRGSPKAHKDRALRARPVPAQRDQVHAPEPHLAQCWRQPVPGQAQMDKPTKGIGSQPVPHPGQGGPRDRPAEAEGATGCPHRGPPLRGPPRWCLESPFRAGQHAAPSLTECPNNRWHGQGSPPSGPGCQGASKVRNLDKNLWVHGTIRHWRSTIPWVTAAQPPHRPGVKSLRHCRPYSGVPASEEVNALAKLT